MRCLRVDEDGNISVRGAEVVSILEVYVTGVLRNAILLTVHVLIQNLEYTVVTPVGYKRLAESRNGIFVSK